MWNIFLLNRGKRRRLAAISKYAICQSRHIPRPKKKERLWKKSIFPLLNLNRRLRRSRVYFLIDWKQKWFLRWRYIFPLCWYFFLCFFFYVIHPLDCYLFIFLNNTYTFFFSSVHFIIHSNIPGIFHHFFFPLPTSSSFFFFSFHSFFPYFQFIPTVAFYLGAPKPFTFLLKIGAANHPQNKKEM